MRNDKVQHYQIQNHDDGRTSISFSTSTEIEIGEHCDDCLHHCLVTNDPMGFIYSRCVFGGKSHSLSMPGYASIRPADCPLRNDGAISESWDDYERDLKEHKSKSGTSNGKSVFNFNSSFRALYPSFRTEKSQ